MNEMQRLLAFKAFPMFSHMVPDALAVLAKHSRSAEFAPGEPLFQLSGQAAELHFVVEGRVALYRDEVCIARFDPGDVVGSSAASTPNESVERCVATRPTSTLSLARPDLEEILEENLDILLALIGGAARELIDLRLQSGPTAGYPSLKPPPLKPVQHPTLGLVERMVLLASARGMRHVSVQVLSQLAEAACASAYQAGHVLWEEGDEATGYVVIASGHIRAEISSTGQAFWLGPGHMAGSVECLGHLPRWYRATTESAGSVLEVSRSQLLDILEDHNDMARQALGAIAATSSWLRLRAAKH